MEVRQIHLGDEWIKEDRGIATSFSQGQHIRKKTGLLKNLHQAIEENFIGWEVKDVDMNYEPRENQYPDAFISAREQQITNEDDRYDH